MGDFCYSESDLGGGVFLCMADGRLVAHERTFEPVDCGCVVDLRRIRNREFGKLYRSYDDDSVMVYSDA